MFRQSLLRFSEQILLVLDIVARNNLLQQLAEPLVLFFPEVFSFSRLLSVPLLCVRALPELAVPEMTYTRCLGEGKVVYGFSSGAVG